MTIRPPPVTMTGLQRLIAALPILIMEVYSGSWPFLHHVSILGIPSALIVGMGI
jgi:hypothetical protein